MSLVFAYADCFQSCVSDVPFCAVISTAMWAHSNQKLHMDLSLDEAASRLSDWGLCKDQNKVKGKVVSVLFLN
jgi:hypothetical protein